MMESRVLWRADWAVCRDLGHLPRESGEEHPNVDANTPSSKTEVAPVANQIYIAGKYFDKEDAKISVYDHGLLYGDGVFEGMRSYGGKVFRLRGASRPAVGLGQGDLAARFR